MTRFFSIFYAVVLAVLIPALAFPANFYWKSSLSELNAITGVTNADKAVVMDANHAVTFYDHLSGAWAAATSSTVLNMVPNDNTKGAVNSAALAAAITAGGKVYVPEGTWWLDTGITNTVNYIHLTGAGRNKTIFKTANAIKMFKFTTVNTYLADFSIDGGNVATTGIQIGNDYSEINTWRSNIERIEISGVDNGLIWNNSGYASIRDIYITGSGSSAAEYGIRLTGGGVHLTNVVVNGFVTNWYMSGSGFTTQSCVSYSEPAHTWTTNLLLMDQAYKNVFNQFTFEHLAATDIAEVLITSREPYGYAPYSSGNIFNNCNWVGVGANSARIQIGELPGTAYNGPSATVINGGWMIKSGPSTTHRDIYLAHAYQTLIDGVIRHREYTFLPETWENPLIAADEAQFHTSHNVILPYKDSWDETPHRGTWELGIQIPSNNYIALVGRTTGWVSTSAGTYSTATEGAGVSDGSTAILTGLSDVTDFNIGEYVQVSAGWDLTGPYKVLAKSASTLTLDTNSTSAQTGITVAAKNPVWTKLQPTQVAVPYDNTTACTPNSFAMDNTGFYWCYGPTSNWHRAAIDNTW